MAGGVGLVRSPAGQARFSSSSQVLETQRPKHLVSGSPSRACCPPPHAPGRWRGPLGMGRLRPQQKAPAESFPRPDPGSPPPNTPARAAAGCHRAGGGAHQKNRREQRLAPCNGLGFTSGYTGNILPGGRPRAGAALLRGRCGSRRSRARGRGCWSSGRHAGPLGWSYRTTRFRERSADVQPRPRLHRGAAPPPPPPLLRPRPEPEPRAERSAPGGRGWTDPAAGRAQVRGRPAALLDGSR